MKKFLVSLIAVFVLLLIQPDIWADMIRMKKGQLIEGKFLGGTEETIRVQTDHGIVECSIKEILTITFLPTSPLSSQETLLFSQETPRFEKTPTPQPKQQTLIIVPGTRLPVRMLDTVDTIQSRKDDWFAATFDLALVVDGIEVVPKGSMAHGQVIQAEQGKYGSALVITLREIILEQQVIPIATTNYTAWDKPPETVDANSLRRQRTLRVSAQTFIEFKTTEPIKIDLSK
jgi:hypothetical protein